MGIVRESLILEAEKTIQISAGLVIIQKGSILLGHPTGQKWWGTYSIPKGMVEDGEALMQAAIRETREEMGITIDVQDIEDTEPEYIEYKDKKGVPYKRVYYFVARPKTPIDNDDIQPDKKEIDWAGFILKDKAEQRIFWRLKPVLKNIEDVEKPEETAAPEKEKGSDEGELDLGL
jgi:ADP-ribose pyrophosphatase YjhB (NUDIX family)